MSQKGDVEVVIPALNEPYLPKLLTKLDLDYHVHVQTEKGLSYAVYCGIKNCKRDVIVVMDGDGSHPPEAINTMLEMLNEKVWFVVGSRYIKNGYSFDTTIRKVLSMFYCAVARLFVNSKIKDSMSGFWVGYRSKFTFQPNGNYKFGLELIRKYKEHIVEYPIRFQKRKIGKSHIKPIQALKDLFAIFYIVKRKNKNRLCQND